MTFSAKPKTILGILGWMVTLAGAEPNMPLNLYKYLRESLTHRGCSISSMNICWNEIGEIITEIRASIQMMPVTLGMGRELGEVWGRTRERKTVNARLNSLDCILLTVCSHGML